MKGIIFLISLLISSTVWATSFVGYVVGVLDGDTIEVIDKDKNRFRIRLNQIDAPEKSQPYGKKAKQFLSNLIFQKQVIIKWTKKDRYHRLLGQVYYYHQDINLLMIQNGYAWAYTRYLKDDYYLLVQKRAEKEKLGLWASHQPAIAPWEWRKNKRK
ncbi:thermonuclease family protein [Pelistega sp. NLN82]|uniref:Thermonuclease family protein n=1 Tax=Pelistega ratti TaxID=2652177 RepID=A0A6L9Y756_9BURK|nr:thermonuclease family protein [Pelistega ratti]NEN76340.1 thermonuclease family protein [Pelistega ratti]